MTIVSTITDSLLRGARTLERSSDSPRLDAEILLSTVLGTSRTGLVVRGAEHLRAQPQKAFEQLLERRLQGTPIAYLTGSREFWSLELTVTPDVLVPRPETELLVELALARLPADAEDQSVLDLGTGSGAIALAIAGERPRARVTGVDVSAAALEVAARNAHKLELHNVDWRIGSWFDAVPQLRFDAIVANPPYIAADDPALASLAAEPLLALTSGSTGLEALAAIIAGAATYLKPGGCLLLEHGSGQADEVVRLLCVEGFLDIRTHLDYSGRPRVALATVALSTSS